MLTSSLSGGLAVLGQPQPTGSGGFIADTIASITSAAIPALGSLLQAYPSLAESIASQVAGQDLGKLMGGASTSEDCLFLDLFVPGKALKGSAKLPVINWIYGGAIR
jgi:hypothetical protein